MQGNTLAAVDEAGRLSVWAGAVPGSLRSPTLALEEIERMEEAADLGTTALRVARSFLGL